MTYGSVWYWRWKNCTEMDGVETSLSSWIWEFELETWSLNTKWEGKKGDWLQKRKKKFPLLLPFCSICATSWVNIAPQMYINLSYSAHRIIFQYCLEMTHTGQLKHSNQILDYMGFPFNRRGMNSVPTEPLKTINVMIDNSYIP